MTPWHSRACFASRARFARDESFQRDPTLPLMKFAVLPRKASGMSFNFVALWGLQTRTARLIPVLSDANLSTALGRLLKCNHNYGRSILEPCSPVFYICKKGLCSVCALSVVFRGDTDISVGQHGYCCNLSDRTICSLPNQVHPLRNVRHEHLLSTERG